MTGVTCFPPVKPAAKPPGSSSEQALGFYFSNELLLFLFSVWLRLPSILIAKSYRCMGRSRGLKSGVKTGRRTISYHTTYSSPVKKTLNAFPIGEGLRAGLFRVRWKQKLIGHELKTSLRAAKQQNGGRKVSLIGGPSRGLQRKEGR